MAIRTDNTLLTKQEAAIELGVSERRIMALRKSGDITSFASGRRGILVTADSVQRYARFSGKGGRPYSEHMAFGALYMISGEAVPWLSAQQRYRLKHYLRDVSAEDLTNLTRRRAKFQEYWCRASLLETVRTQMRVSAATGQLASSFQLAPNNVIEGYANQETADYLVAKYRLKLNASPVMVRLRISEKLPSGEGAMPIGVCAADLAQSEDPRERRAGLETLTRLLASFRETGNNSK
ncbi:MAG: helix-turn-helix domain-containing protein [Bifidobacterium tibiigranuli]|jgi:hypothetical protein|nr:helix-turn-helix domain-containing protein [Bifidobacterium tibiigranuli]